MLGAIHRQLGEVAPRSSTEHQAQQGTTWRTTAQLKSPFFTSPCRSYKRHFKGAKGGSLGTLCDYRACQPRFDSGGESRFTPLALTAWTLHTGCKCESSSVHNSRCSNSMDASINMPSSHISHAFTQHGPTVSWPNPVCCVGTLALVPSPPQLPPAPHDALMSWAYLGQ